MTSNKEKMVDTLIRAYGFENETVIGFAQLAEDESFPESALINLFNIIQEKL